MTAPFLAACHSGLIFNSSCGCSGGGGGGALKSNVGFLAGGGPSSNPGGGGWSDTEGLGSNLC